MTDNFLPSAGEKVPKTHLFSLSFLFRPHLEPGVGVTGVVEGVTNAEYDIILVELSVGVHRHGKGVPEVDILKQGTSPTIFKQRRRDAFIGIT